MASSKPAVYITEDGPSTLAPVTSHAGDEISGPPQRQAAQDAHESVHNLPDIPLDIEHQPVKNDPRLWSDRRKMTIVGIIAFACLAPTLGVNLYNPAFAQIKKQLHANDSQIALSLALYILVQGNAPLLWSALSEIKGRKIPYIASMALFLLGSAVCGAARNMNVLIGMRILQAAGSSAVLNLGAGTLADMYESHERGTMMGIYFAGPLLGPSLGPIIGGALTVGFSWRATFWFLVIFSGISLCTFLFLPDTFRRERSMSYQTAKRRVLKERARRSQAGSRVPSPTRSGTVTPMTGAQTPVYAGSINGKDNEKSEKAKDSKKVETIGEQDFKLSVMDISPIRPIWFILKQRTNVCILSASGILFAFQYGICFTAALTFARAPYHFNSIKVGLVLLSFGIGNLAGSILGGRWSDHVLAKLRKENGGVIVPEMRLQSTKPAMVLLPLLVLAYAWMCEKHVNVAGPVVVLFFAGFAAIWIYSSTLAYIVDANPGRASSAIAANSSFRGLSGLIIAEISVPLQNAIGDGGLYTIWAGLLVICEALILLLIWRGGRWRAGREQAAAV